MTWTELKPLLDKLMINYGKDFDTKIGDLWMELFANFDAELFKAACLKIIGSNKFFPSASEVLEAYQEAKSELKRKRLEADQGRQKLLCDSQAYCCLCDNSGVCFFRAASGYDYPARCVCAHGRDLNKFSQAQIDPSYIPESRDSYNVRAKAAINRGENPFYMPDIREALKDDFPVFEAARKERYISRKSQSSAEQLEILKSLKSAFAEKALN